MNDREQELKDDEEFERQIEDASIRAVTWKGDVGEVPKPKKKPFQLIKQYRPRL